MQQLVSCLEFVTKVFNIEQNAVDLVLIIPPKVQNDTAQIKRKHEILKRILDTPILHARELKIKYCYECTQIDPSYADIRHFDSIVKLRK